MPKSAVLTVAVVTDASAVPKGLAQASASYGKFAAAIGAKTPTAATMAGDKLVSGIDRALKTGLKVAGLAGGALLGTALFKGFERLNAIDQAQAKLKGLGYDAKTVTKIMTNALASVKGTAFGLGEAATVAAQITAAGIKPGKQLESTLKLVADSATIAGTDMQSMGAIWAKVAAQNKVQGDVINQLTDAGIPILQLLAKHYKVTAAQASKMVSKGKVDFAAFAASMKAGMGGAALESGNTFEGAWKNTIAALGRIGANLLEPLFTGAKDGLKGLPALMEPLEAEAKKWGQALAGAVTWVQQNIDLVKKLGMVAGGVIAVLLAFRGFVAIMQAYRAVVTAVTTATQIWKAVQLAVNGAIASNPVGALVTLIVLLVTALIWFFTQTKIGQKIWAGFISFLKSAWGGIVSFFKTTFAAIGGWWKSMVAGIKSVFGAVVSWFRSAWQNVTNFFKLAIIGFKIVFAAVFSTIRGVVSRGASFFRSAWSSAVNAVRTIVGALRAVFSSVFNGVRAIVSSVASFFRSTWQGAVNAVRSVVNTLRGVFTNVFNAILGPINAVKNAISTVVGWVQTLIGWISKIHIPNLGGISKLLGASSKQSAQATPAAAYTSPSVTRIMAGAHVARAPRVGAVARPAYNQAGGGIVININGGLDSKDAIARRVEQVVGGRTRRTHGVVNQLRAR